MTKPRTDGGNPSELAHGAAGHSGEVPLERFDDLLGRLKGLVEKLESGNLSLEDSLRCFEEGVGLCRRGSSILDAAEKRVEVLLAGPQGDGARGSVVMAPFEDGAAHGE